VEESTVCRNAHDIITVITGGGAATALRPSNDHKSTGATSRARYPKSRVRWNVDDYDLAKKPRTYHFLPSRCEAACCSAKKLRNILSLHLLHHLPYFLRLYSEMDQEKLGLEIISHWGRANKWIKSEPYAGKSGANAKKSNGGGINGTVYYNID
jgi:hypothetical protein